MKTLKAWSLNSIYLIIYTVMMPVILYKRICRGRSLGSFRERVLGLAPRVHSDHHCVWLHAVSVGEVNLLHTLLQDLQSRHPDSRFVISTTTATGMRLARERYPDYKCFYFPIDFSWAIGNALRRVSPDLIVLAELEIWPNLIDIADARNVPVVVINGRLSKESFAGYLKRLRLVRPTFEKLHQVVAQSNEYARRFVQLGCPSHRVHVSGSIKFDGAMSEPDSTLLQSLRKTLRPDRTDIVWVAGSTQEPEEAIVAKIWSELVLRFPELRLVIVPRHPHRGEKILASLGRLGVTGRLRSRDTTCLVRRDEVLIADTIGELKAWWALTNVAFVGGSFGDRGGQNMLEPAACGAAVCFGPNTWNFKQIVHLMLANDVATQVQSEAELRTFVEKCLTDQSFATNRGKAARQLVESSQGAISTTCDLLDEYFVSPAMSPANQVSKAA